MNSNLNRALSAALVALGGAASALGQFDSDVYCADVNNTAPYSADFNNYQQRTRLFGAELGIAGTITLGNAPNYPVYCQGGGPVRGRIGFTIGTEGSYQDDDPNQAGQFVNPITGQGVSVHDNNLELTLGANFGNAPAPSINPPSKFGGYYLNSPTGGQSYARIYVARTPNSTTPTTTTTSYLYGVNPFNYAYFGRSGRYMLADETETTGIDVRLVIDVLGDAARLTWTIADSINTTDTVAVGLYFGQHVALLDESGAYQYVQYGLTDNAISLVDIPYITIPGRRPLTEQERFNNTGFSPPTAGFPNGQADGATVGVPPYVNFSVSQTVGFGLQVVNSPTILNASDPTSGNDQTPVDEFVIGEAPFLIDGRTATTDPQFGDQIFNAPGNGNIDAAALGDSTASPPSVAYLQKWLPAPVTNGAARTIVSYYRSTNFDTSYATSGFNSYTVSVDTPKAISTSRVAGAITTDNPYTPNPFTLRVHVDNTGGFSNASAPVTLGSTTVTLNLPAGMYDPATNNRTITKSIQSVGVTDIQSVDFQVAVDPRLAGAQQYTVVVAPQAGTTSSGSVITGFQQKTITGTINVAASPRLQVRAGANLVSPPWQFNDASWESVLGLSLNADFQAYTWDALRQQYIAQPAAQRGIGTWIVSQDEIGYKVLGGGPKQPDDEFPSPFNYDQVPGAGSPSILLHQGWNLVGNPYNYAFPIGNLVGVPVSGSASLTFAQLQAGNLTDGTFIFYDQTNKSYTPLANLASTVLPPNNGYWIYAQSDFYLQFPPLFELFLRGATSSTTESQRANSWKLQLAATSSSASDAQNFVGIAPTGQAARIASLRKPPTALTGKGDALTAFVTGDGGASMMRSIRASSGAQTYTFNVLSKNGGAVTVSWPNLKSIPSNLQVKVTDPARKTTIDARKTSGYTISAKASTVYPLTITVSPQPVTPERITSSSYSIVSVSGQKQMRLSFGTSAPGSATVTAYKGGSLVSTIASDVDIVAGTNSVLWPMTDSKGQPLPNGTYTVVFKAVGEDNSVATRQMIVNVRH